MTLIELLRGGQRPPLEQLPPCDYYAEVWGQRIQRLLEKTRLLGSYFSTDRQRLRQLAQQRGVHTIDNVAALIA